MIALSLSEIRDLTGGRRPRHRDRRRRRRRRPRRPPTPGSAARAASTSPGSARPPTGTTIVAAAVAAGRRGGAQPRPSTGVPCVVVDDVQTAFGRVARGVVDRAPEPRGRRASPARRARRATKDLLASVLSSVAETVAPVNSLNGEIGVPLTVCRVTPDDPLPRRRDGRPRHRPHRLPDAHRAAAGRHRPQRRHRPRRRVRLAREHRPRQVRAAPGRAGRRASSILNADDPVVAAMAAGPRVPGAARRASRRGGRARRGRPPRRARQGGIHPRVPAGHGARSRCSRAAPTTSATRSPSRPPRSSSACRSTRWSRGSAAAEAVSRWRMEITDRPDGVVVVNDAYNANPDSMRAALDAVAAIGHGPGTRAGRCSARCSSSAT